MSFIRDHQVVGRDVAHNYRSQSQELTLRHQRPNAHCRNASCRNANGSDMAPTDLIEIPLKNNENVLEVDVNELPPNPEEILQILLAEEVDVRYYLQIAVCWGDEDEDPTPRSRGVCQCANFAGMPLTCVLDRVLP